MPAQEEALLDREYGQVKLDSAINALGDAIQQHWDNSPKRVVIKFLVHVFLAFINLMFVVQQLLKKQTDGTMGTISTSIVRIEALVVIVSCIRIPLDIIAIRRLPHGHAFMQIQILSDNLDVVASFSLLAFVPVPAKLMYWWEHRDRLWKYYVNPSFLHGYSIFEPDTLIQHLRALNICVPYALTIYFICQVLIPLLMVCLPFLALPAFLAKVQYQSDPKQILSWQAGEYLSALALLNQASKIWDSHVVEKYAVLELLNRIGEGADSQVEDTRTKIWKAALLKLGPWKSIMILNNQGIKDISDLVKSSFRIEAKRD